MRILYEKDRKLLRKYISATLGYVLTVIGENLEYKHPKYLRIAEDALREFDRSLPAEIYENIEQEVEATMQGIRICLQIGMQQKIAQLKNKAKGLSPTETRISALMGGLQDSLREIGSGKIKFDRHLQEAMERDLNRVEMLLEEIASSTPSPSNAHSQNVDHPSLPVRGN